MDITNPVIRDYLESVMPQRPKALQKLNDQAIREGIPIIKHEMEQFLNFLVRVHQPKQILEIGTAIGYSAITMFLASEGEAHMVTLEKSPKMLEKAIGNFDDFGMNNHIQVIEGDAEETIKTLEQPFDLIFIDAAKGQYINYYYDALPLLKPDGLVIADNILQDGLIAKSRFAIPRRQRTIHARMRKLIKIMSSNKDLITTVLAIGDGVVVGRKKGERLKG